jgi:hypothetical protein
MLLTVPHVAARDTTRAFLGLVGAVREYSLLLLPPLQGGPGFAVTADAQEVSVSMCSTGSTSYTLCAVALLHKWCLHA